MLFKLIWIRDWARSDGGVAVGSIGVGDVMYTVSGLSIHLPQCLHLATGTPMPGSIGKNTWTSPP
jgi:hypothetical protein